SFQASQKVQLSAGISIYRAQELELSAYPPYGIRLNFLVSSLNQQSIFFMNIIMMFFKLKMRKNFNLDA
ncbi:MAG: hypothetical protein WCG42_03485, partial [Parachlamydiaceae bacterium]